MKKNKITTTIAGKDHPIYKEDLQFTFFRNLQKVDDSQPPLSDEEIEALDIDDVLDFDEAYLKSIGIDTDIEEFKEKVRCIVEELQSEIKSKNKRVQ